MSDYLYKKETDGIIAAFYEVYNTLGYGFLERVYQNAFHPPPPRFALVPPVSGGEGPPE